jgi:hypothetical protein
LLQWKTETGLCDKGFEKLLKIIKKKLPKDNELPDSTYKEKKCSLPSRIRGAEDTCMH